jgi:subtilisin family serine protease
MYPAALEHVVSVAATDSSDHRAYLSEHNEFVDLAAPGVYIYSAHLGGGYTRRTGTSMSTPLVAGLAGLVKTMRPYWDSDQIEAHLKVAADKIGTDPYVDGRNNYFGYGRVNAATAVWTLDPPSLAVSEEQIQIRAQAGLSATATVTLTNTSAGVTEWQSVVASGENWLSVSPANGVVSLAAPVTLTLRVSEDTPVGLHSGVVRILSSNPYLEGEPPEIVIDAHVQGAMRKLFFPVLFVGGE